MVLMLQHYSTKGYMALHSNMLESEGAIVWEHLLITNLTLVLTLFQPNLGCEAWDSLKLHIFCSIALHIQI